MAAAAPSFGPCRLCRQPDTVCQVSGKCAVCDVLKCPQCRGRIQDACCARCPLCGGFLLRIR